MTYGVISLVLYFHSPLARDNTDAPHEITLHSSPDPCYRSYKYFVHMPTLVSMPNYILSGFLSGFSARGGGKSAFLKYLEGGGGGAPLFFCASFTQFFCLACILQQPQVFQLATPIN